MKEFSPTEQTLQAQSEAQLAQIQKELESLRAEGMEPSSESDEQKQFESQLSISKIYERLFDEGGLDGLEGAARLAVLESELGDSGVSKQRPVAEQIQYFLDERKQILASLDAFRQQGFVERTAEQKKFDDLSSAEHLLQALINQEKKQSKVASDTI